MRYKPFLLSAAIHMILLFWLIVAVPVSSFRLPEPASDLKPVVQAKMINAEPVTVQPREAPQTEVAHPPTEVKPEPDRAAQQREKAIKQAKLEALQLAQLKAQHAKDLELAQKKKQQLIQKQYQQQHELAMLKQQQAELAERQKNLQETLLQQQMASEQQQLVQVQQLQGVVDQYRARILIAISRQWIIPDETDPTISCIFVIELTSGGVVSRVRLVKSSGNVGLDRAAEAAIHKASPLPVPGDPNAFNAFRHFTLKMTPQDVDH